MSLINQTLSENVAAISATVHASPRFSELYELIRDEVSGFPGIWQLCAAVGQYFTDAEYAGRHVAGETYEWVDAIHEMANRIFEVCIDGDGPNSVAWQDEAHAAIIEHSF